MSIQRPLAASSPPKKPRLETPSKLSEVVMHRFRRLETLREPAASVKLLKGMQNIEEPTQGRARIRRKPSSLKRKISQVEAEAL